MLYSRERLLDLEAERLAPYAQKARDFMSQLSDNYSSKEDIDLNILAAEPLYHSTNLLHGFVLASMMSKAKRKLE